MQKVEQMAETIKTFQVAQIGEYIIRRVIVEISNRISSAAQSLPKQPYIGFRSTNFTSPNSDDWTSGWDTWGQGNQSAESASKSKKSSKKTSSKVIKNDDQDNQLINLGDEGARQKKKSALSDAWDNDGWETLNKDD